MRQIFFTVIMSLGMICITCAQPVVIDTTIMLAPDDSAQFWALIPEFYSPTAPPAILIWWHQLGGTQYEMPDFSTFDSAAYNRGWIAASHLGPNDRHYNSQWAQRHCRAMLRWIYERYPFALDSIYMIGGSMGGAAGQVWHNNNCSSTDSFFITATAGGSQILDCQLRQEQYLADGDTIRSMRAAFGGLPGDRDSVAFEYHRNSAIFAADTTQSMHFNSLNLPVWNAWGNSPEEDERYGAIAQIWDSLRRADQADTTVTFQSSENGHGVGFMPVEDICNWLSGFSANRYPDRISINADESGDYYWTHVELIRNDTTFGRYGVQKNFTERRLDVSLIRNIQSLDIRFTFPWGFFDSLECIAEQLDPAYNGISLALTGLPEVLHVIVESGDLQNHSYADGRLILQGNGTFRVLIYLEPTQVPQFLNPVPDHVRLVGAYPNPFNSVINLILESPRGMRDWLILYDILGREKLRIHLEIATGTQLVPLSANGFSSGIYFAQLSNSSQQPLRIVLLR